MKYGRNLKKLRNNAGLSQQELADQLNINRETYARYETSSSEADYDTLQRLADYFSVSIDFLLRGDKILKNRNNTLMIMNEELKEWYLKMGEASEEDLKNLKDLKLIYDTFIDKKHE